MAQVAIRGGEEVAEPALQLVGGFIGGSLQRVAWNTSSALGFFTTGIMLAGGAVGAFMMDGLGRAALEGIAVAGATIGGWVLTEQFLIPGKTPAPPSQVTGSRAQQMAARMRRQLAEGTPPSGRYPAPAVEEEFAGIRLS